MYRVEAGTVSEATQEKNKTNSRRRWATRGRSLSQLVCARQGISRHGLILEETKTKKTAFLFVSYDRGVSGTAERG